MFAICHFSQDSGGRILSIKRKLPYTEKDGSPRGKTNEIKSKCNVSPLTRKLPFAQVLGFALLAARHVGLVTDFQLSSHWEILSYKVNSKWNIFIDASDSQQGKKKKAMSCWSYRGWGVVRCGLCGALHDFFAKREWWGYSEAPCAASSSADVTFCELERQALDELRHTKHGQGEGGQWEGDKS